MDSSRNFTCVSRREFPTDSLEFIQKFLQGFVQEPSGITLEFFEKKKIAIKNGISSAIPAAGNPLTVAPKTVGISQGLLLWFLWSFLIGILQDVFFFCVSHIIPKRIYQDLLEDSQQHLLEICLQKMIGKSQQELPKKLQLEFLKEFQQ